MTQIHIAYYTYTLNDFRLIPVLFDNHENHFSPISSLHSFILRHKKISYKQVIGAIVGSRYTTKSNLLFYTWSGFYIVQFWAANCPYQSEWMVFHTQFKAYVMDTFERIIEQNVHYFQVIRLIDIKIEVVLRNLFFQLCDKTTWQ